MVIFLHFEMEDDARRSSKKAGLLRWFSPGSRSSPSTHSRKSLSGSPLLPPRERRPLRSVPLIGPHYRVEPEVLVSGFVEKEAKYLGTVADLRCDFDATDRTALLKIVDEKQTLDILPCQLTYKNDIIISFSVHNIKLLERDGEKLKHRIETHKIAAVGYVRDDNQHLVFIKFASKLDAKRCNLAILCCETKTAAEEVCSLAQQVFQLVYTDSTIDFLDKSIMDGAITPKNHSYSTDDSDKRDTVTESSREYQPYCLDKSTDSIDILSTSRRLGPDIGVTRGTHWGAQPTNQRHNTDPWSEIPAGSSYTFPQSGRPYKLHRRSGSSGSSNNNGAHITAASTTTLISPSMSTQAIPVHVQLQDYKALLKEKLTNVELKKFAELLHQFRTGGMSIQDFSRTLLEMYTEQRKFLLLDMRHFIPEPEDLEYFNRFLKENNVTDVTELTTSSWWTRPPHTVRTFSETEESTTSTTVNPGQATEAVSLSSSGSEKAHASFLSKDDNEDWRDLGKVLVERLVYPSKETSAASAEIEGTRRTVNGTSPKHDISMQLPPTLKEVPLSQSHTPTVAAVPEGFRDSLDPSDLDSDSATGNTSGDRDKQAVFGKKEKTKKQSKPTNSKHFSSSTDGLEQDSDEFTRETSQKFKKGKRRTSKTLLEGQGGTDFSKPPIPTKSQHSKPQKEHRKKKKHKESTGSINL